MRKFRSDMMMVSGKAGCMPGRKRLDRIFYKKPIMMRTIHHLDVLCVFRLRELECSFRQDEVNGVTFTWYGPTGPAGRLILLRIRCEMRN